MGRFTGCPCTFWSKTWFYVTGAGDRMVLEDGNVSLRGRFQGIGHVVKIVAGAVFCGRCQNVGRRVSFEGLRLT